ncbi:MAG: C40 family peptidase [Flavobacteriia bacterium]|nr:C40 family peptidase [Flavobacteriia bacterium]OIP46721.1 MAG: glycoside hydrolase [Flavobacteriaceae bacterium CG2_30_31_66]PIV95778.1 MAG: glycoside hydrolase [Flavobacteriaceae bacterium CG17_big_fil_post_rev_8_21_14_2_50_31_13]PIX13543.1 MAG: glycoside hydrolase [Flavobacteriaceae bacterium CG_4_8_14_3_um_filter_31_8]PIY16153.1 MAG: glycoside hydrolase [Flavobacteriaceae bacterium CG_4_10_14_3_um_filter_31_253]PIZ11294.1 MAG: glycoside hydrolase [Flavobacteriaceae bacterium CG_4_10_14_0
MKFLKIVVCLIFIAFISCKNDVQTIEALEKMTLGIKQEYAPDKRVELFDIQFIQKNNHILLQGETTSRNALTILMDSLQKRNLKFENNVRVLPDSAVGNFQFAVAKNSVINIRSEASHSAELGTQGLLGMSLKVLDKNGDFYRIQTPDNYISWVDKGGIQLMNEAEIKQWDASKKVLFTALFGFVYAQKDIEKSIISDISLGGMLQYIAEDAQFYQVKYPDNRMGFIKKNDAVNYDSWLKNLISTNESIEKIAKKMAGFPYLWGGTSAKGMDCSGFIKMVYLMNGFIIPRDASQQINVGKTVDENLNFLDLQKGDLLFFGKKATENSKQKVTHVGIWLGNDKQEFIHASGNVHISSMDKTQPHFDEMNKNRYLGSKRYLGEKDPQIIDLKTIIDLKE